MEKMPTPHSNLLGMWAMSVVVMTTITERNLGQKHELGKKSLMCVSNLKEREP